MGRFILIPANKSTSSPLQLASRSRCSSPCTERARDVHFCTVPGSVADRHASQCMHVEAERRGNSATGALGNTLRQEIGPDLTSKATPVRIFSFSLSGPGCSWFLQSLSRVWMTRKLCRLHVGSNTVSHWMRMGMKTSLFWEAWAHNFPNAVLYTSGVIMAIAVWALGIKKTF